MNIVIENRISELGSNSGQGYFLQFILMPLEKASALNNMQNNRAGKPF